MSRQSNKLCNILISSIVANIIFFIITAGLYIYKEKFVKHDKASDMLDSRLKLPGGTGVCIPCDYLGEKVTANDTLFDSITTSQDGKHKLCCTNKPTFLPELIGKMLMTEDDRVRHEKDKYKTEEISDQLRWWRNRPNSVHMHLDIEKLKDNKFVWRTDDSLGVSYKKDISINTTSNSIVVPRIALYFVYVAITFDFGDIPSVPIFYHNVTKSHPLLPRTIDTLLMSKYGGSSESKRDYTSFLCGTFKMQGDFNIKTEVSSYDYVSKSKYASYFGMFRI